MATEIDLGLDLCRGAPAGLIRQLLAETRIEALAPDGEPGGIEDWVTAQAASQLLSGGEAAVTSSRGTLRASLKRSGRLRSGMLLVRTTGDNGVTGRARPRWAGDLNRICARRSATAWLTTSSSWSAASLKPGRQRRRAAQPAVRSVASGGPLVDGADHISAGPVNQQLRPGHIYRDDPKAGHMPMVTRTACPSSDVPPAARTKIATAADRADIRSCCSSLIRRRPPRSIRVARLSVIARPRGCVLMAPFYDGGCQGVRPGRLPGCAGARRCHRRSSGAALILDASGSESWRLR
jgi:hypothetical protein